LFEITLKKEWIKLQLLNILKELLYFSGLAPLRYFFLSHPTDFSVESGAKVNRFFETSKFSENFFFKTFSRTFLTVSADFSV